MIPQAPIQENVLRAGAPRSPSQAGPTDPVPISTEAIDALYKSLLDEHEKTVHARLSNDEVLASRLRAFGLQRTALQTSARQNAGAAREAQDAQAHLKAAMAVASTMAHLARAQERTAIELAPHRRELAALELQPFDDFLQSRPDLTPQLREQLRTIARADEPDQRTQVFAYDDALSSLVNLGLDRDGEDILYYASPPAIALQERKTPDLQLLFRESGDGLTLARTPTSQAIDAALVIAAARWNNCISLSGDNAFIDATLRRAATLGIAVTNPELQARLETLRTEASGQRRTLADQPLRLPAWLPTPVAAIAGPPAGNPTELRMAELCAALRASGFAAGASELVDVRSLAPAQLDAAYATTLQTTDGPIIAACDAKRRVLVAAVADAPALTNAAIAYQGSLSISTGPTPEISIASSRAAKPKVAELTSAREAVGGRSL